MGFISFITPGRGNSFCGLLLLTSSAKLNTYEKNSLVNYRIADHELTNHTRHDKRTGYLAAVTFKKGRHAADGGPERERLRKAVF